MKRVLNISILLISIFMCCTIGYATDNPNSDGYYDFEFRTSRLGQYKVELTATETPFYETLPLDKVPGLYDKFPTSTWTGYTEVDNTEPSARYGTPIPKIKVDVAFATGAMGDQMDAFQNSIAELEAKLRDSRNNLDVKIQYVKTVTLDLSSMTSQQILDTWYNYPGLGGHYEAGWYADGTTLTTTSNVNWTGFLNWTEEALNTTDGTYEFELTFKDGGTHPDPQGWTFRTIRDNSGSYSFYGLEIDKHKGYANLYCITKWTPSLSYPTHGGPYYHGCISGCDGTYDCTQKTASSEGATGHHIGRASIGANLASYRVKIENVGKNIKVYVNDQLIIHKNDDTLSSGTYGPYTASQWEAKFGDISVTSGGTKTLVQATTDVNWRDDAHRFIIHSTDEVPQELQPGHDSEFTELISYLNSGNIFLFNLGIDAVNKDEFNRLDEALIDAQGNPRSKYLRNYPIKERMLQAAQEIIDMLKQFQTESEWILVDSDINWTVVEWADFEQDVPLNFGEHDGTGRYGDIDKQVSLDWGVSLTHLWTQPKILAERWRFRHFEDYFDNNLGKVNYNGAWIEDAPTSFSKTGKYRINYQRKDNPLHTDVSLSSVFDMYRKWSTNYNDN